MGEDASCSIAKAALTHLSKIAHSQLLGNGSVRNGVGEICPYLILSILCTAMCGPREACLVIVQCDGVEWYTRD